MKIFVIHYYCFFPVKSLNLILVTLALNNFFKINHIIYPWRTKFQVLPTLLMLVFINQHVSESSVDLKKMYAFLKSETVTNVFFDRALERQDL
jgi:hypothetical protein